MHIRGNERTLRCRACVMAIAVEVLNPARSTREGRRCSMRWNMFVGALVVSVGLSSQSFGFELLDRMLGLNDCGCNSCCEPQCCEKSCAPACEQACAPACAAPACEPACATACEPACCDNGHGHRRHRGHGCCEGNVKCGCNHWGVKTCHSHDLFCGLRGLFDCHRDCCDNGCDQG